MKISEDDVVKRLREMAKLSDGDSAVLANALFILDKAINQHSREIKSAARRITRIEKQRKKKPPKKK